MSVYMLWFSFNHALHFTFLCFKLIIIHYCTSEKKKIKFKPRILKLNLNKFPAYNL